MALQLLPGKIVNTPSPRVDTIKVDLSILTPDIRILLYHFPEKCFSPSFYQAGKQSKADTIIRELVRSKTLNFYDGQ